MYVCRYAARNIQRVFRGSLGRKEGRLLQVNDGRITVQQQDRMRRALRSVGAGNRLPALGMVAIPTVAYKTHIPREFPRIPAITPKITAWYDKEKRLYWRNAEKGSIQAKQEVHVGKITRTWRPRMRTMNGIK